MYLEAIATDVVGIMQTRPAGDRNKTMNVVQYARLTPGYFSPFKRGGKVKKAVVETEKCLEKNENALELQTFRFFIFSKKNSSLGKKKHFCDEDYHTNHNLRQFWTRITE